MDLNPGHGGRHWGRLDIEQADGGGADEHQLPLYTVAGHAPLQHILGRNVTGGIVPIEMNPEATVLIGRRFQAGNGNALHAGLVGAHEDRARIRHYAQQLDRKRRHERSLRLHDNRHPADNPIALRQDRKYAAAGRRLLDQRDVTQQAWKRYEKGAGVRPPNGKAGL